MITSISNSRVQWIRDLQRKRRTRSEQGLFVVEGIRLAEEALRAGATPRLVVHGQHLDPRASTLVAGFSHRGAPVLLVSDRVLAACASTESPQGLVAVMPIPNIPLPAELSLAIVVDGLADPGNLGSLLRTALAAGVETVFLCSGTVDAYNPKVVRGGMGAHFRLPIVSDSPEAVLRRLSSVPIWLAAPRAGLPYDRLDARRPLALVIGGEARGPAEIWKGQVTGTISIPTTGDVESLNAAAAAAVILFEIRRQRGTS